MQSLFPHRISPRDLTLLRSNPPGVAGRVFHAASAIDVVFSDGFPHRDFARLNRAMISRIDGCDPWAESRFKRDLCACPEFMGVIFPARTLFT